MAIFRMGIPAQIATIFFIPQFPIALMVVIACKDIYGILLQNFVNAQL